MSETRVLDIVIADKNPLLLRGLVDLFSSDPRFEVRATADDGDLFLKLTRRLSFDIGVIGWKMPYMGGRGVLESLKKNKGTVRIVVYSGVDVSSQVMALGGAAFYSKTESPEGLMDAVDQVGRGKIVFPYEVLSPSTKDTQLAELTSKEFQILEYLSQGKTNRQLASHFQISINTVKFHLKNLYEKICVDNRAHAVAFYNEAKGEYGN